MADLNKTYIVHCAEAVCDMGMRNSAVVLTRSHGVYLKNVAQMHIEDKEEENIICFGGCFSPENPKTIEAAMEIEAQVEGETGVSFDDQILDVFTISEEDGKKHMNCVGECIPVIISEQWDSGKEDVFVEEERKALLGEATLTCKYGGIIKIIGSGQPEA